MFKKILFICTGNICRSPLAEALLRTQLEASGRQDVEVRSAGIGALVGKPADETVLFIAKSDPTLAAALEPHRGQQLSPELTRWADLILAMETHHMQYVVRMDPTARGKTFLIGHWMEVLSVGDPYMKHEEVYREAHGQIAKAIASWRQRLG